MDVSDSFKKLKIIFLIISALIIIGVLFVLFGGLPQSTPQPTGQKEINPEQVKELQSSLYDKLKEEKYQEVQQQAEELVKKYPNQSEFMQIAANSYYVEVSRARKYNRAKLKRAEKLFSEYLQANKPSADDMRGWYRYLSVWYNYLSLENYLFKYDEGITLGKELLKEVPSEIKPQNILMMIGVLNDQKGDRKEAEKYYNEVLKINPRHPYVHFFLSRLAVGDEGGPNTEKIIEHAKKTIEYSKQFTGLNAKGYIMLSEGYHYAGDYNEALRWSNKAMEVMKDAGVEIPGVYHLMGENLFEVHTNGGIEEAYFKGYLDQAIKYQEKSIEINPYFSDSYLHLGIAYWLVGDKEKAIATFKKGLEILPRDFEYPAWAKDEFRKELEELLDNPNIIDQRVIKIELKVKPVAIEQFL